MIPDAWPQSLRSAVALDELARDVYRARVDYYGLPRRDWDDVPFHLRSGYVELAKRILDSLQPPNLREPDDRLFAFATALAKQVCPKPMPSRVVAFPQET